MKITRLSLDSANRMIRIGFGKHNGKWFARIDLWAVGYRLTGSEVDFATSKK